MVLGSKFHPKIVEKTALGRLGASWRVLGPSEERLCIILGRLGIVLGRLEIVLGRLGCVLRRPGCVLERLGEPWERLGPSWRPSWRPRTLLGKPVLARRTGSAYVVVNSLCFVVFRLCAFVSVCVCVCACMRAYVCLFACVGSRSSSRSSGRPLGARQTPR